MRVLPPPQNTPPQPIQDGVLPQRIGGQAFVISLLDLKALRGSCDLAPDGPVRDHVVADDPRAVAECHPAARFPNFRPLVCLAGKERGLVRVAPYSRRHQLIQES